MRLKKSVVITFFVIVFGILSFIYLKNNKDIIYKNIISDNKKYLIAYSEGKVNSGIGCHKYYESLKNVNKVFKYSEVSEGYPMYVLNGCAVELDYYLEKTADDVNACNVQKDYAKKNAASSTIINKYNDDCGNITGKLEVSYNGLNCNDAKKLIVNNYLDYIGLYKDWFLTVGDCPSKGIDITLGEIKKVNYSIEPGNCERTKIFNKNATSFDDLGYTGILRRQKFNDKNAPYQNECEYPLFYVDGYSTTYKDYVNKLGDSGKNKVISFCNNLKTEVLNNTSNDELYYASKYEYDLVCVDNKISEPIDGTNFCNYAVPSSITGEHDVHQVEQAGGVKDPASQLYKKTVAVSYKNLVNKDGYKYPAFVVRGAAWSLESIINNTDNECITNDFKNDCCNIQKEFVQAKLIGIYPDVENYNKLCADRTGGLTVREGKTLYFSAPGSYGLSCPKKSSEPDEYSVTTNASGQCEYNFYNLTCDWSNPCEYYLSTSDFPKTTYKDPDDGSTKEMFQYTTGGLFTSWKNSFGEITKEAINAGGTIKLTFYPDSEYKASYSVLSDEFMVYNLFNNCDYAGDGLCAGTRSGNKTKNSGVIKENKDDYGNDVLKYCGIEDTSMLKSTVESQHKYVSDSEDTNESIKSNTSSFTINKFCTILCNETFSYSYPSIFETVKSGTYFELLSYPFVNSSFYCVESHNYQQWKVEYEKSISDEKKAYVDMVNSNNINSFSELDYSSTTSCGYYCSSYSCGSEGKSCCKVYYDKATLTNDGMLDYNQNNKTFTYSECQPYASVSKAKEQARYEFGLSSSVNYEERYRIYLNQRRNLENMNDACFNAMITSESESEKDWELSGVEVYQNNTLSSIDESNKVFHEFIDEKGYDTSNIYELKRENYSKKKITTGYTSDKLYQLDPTIKFHYKSDYFNSSSSSLIPGSGYKEEELKATNSYVYDSGVTDWEGETLNYKVISYNVKYGSVDNTFYSRLTKDSFIRNVTRKFIFSKGDSSVDYYSNFQTGKITNDDNEAGNSIYLGYVYPVPLTTSGENNVYFTISANTNLGYGANEILSDSQVSHDNINGKNVYKCSYNVSNDIIVKEKTSVGSEEKYKKNFYVRSISTSDVDPNDRMSNGKLGANWANERGTSLIEIIEKKSEGKNTYNPNNLEYSFTLNAGTIEAIRGYNDINRYDDFKFTCNDMGGECKSDFLNELAGINSNNETRVNGVEVTGVNPVIKRDSWKYYINGEWMKTKSITNDTNNWVNLLTDVKKSGSAIFNIGGYDCLKKAADGTKLDKDTYDCLYRKINKGVLP